MAGLLLYLGIRFYKKMDWEEPAEASPDLKAMHKRQAELLHIQDVLVGAYREGKLSQNVVDEFNRYCEKEIQALNAVETAWNERRRSH